MVEIRPLGTADYEAICEVWKASGIHYQTTGRESREAFAQQMNTGIQTVLGASIDGKLVGVVVVTHDGRKGWINRLGILPDYQRQGIGSALVEAADKLLHEQGLTIVAALVERENVASLNMFQRAGFQINDVIYLTKRDHPNA